MLQDTFIPVNISNEKLEELINSYFNSVPGLKLHSKRTYRPALGHFAEYCRTHSFSYLPEDLQAYLHYLEDVLHFKPNSVNSNLTALRVFFSYLVSSSILLKNPARRFPNKRSESKTGYMVLDEFAIDSLCSASHADYPTLRNAIVLRLFFQYGLSFSIISNLKLADVQTQANEFLLYCRSRGRRIRVKLDSFTHSEITRLIALSQYRMKKDSYLFYSLSNRAHNSRLSVRSTRLIVVGGVSSYCGENAAVNIRSTAINHLLRQGVAEDEIMKRMEVKTYQTIEKHRSR